MKELEQKIKAALKQDFKNLIREGFATDWQSKRIIMDCYIETMRIDSLIKLFGEDVDT